MTTSETRRDIGDGWRRVAAIAAAAWLVWTVVLSAIVLAEEGRLEPFVLVFGLVPGAAWLLTRWKPGRLTYTIFGVLGLASLLLNLPFVIADLGHPESALGFNVGAVALLAALLQTLVGVRAWASLSDRVAARAWQAAAALFVVGLAVSLVAALGLEDDEPQAGDIRVSAERVEFHPATISAPAGAFAIFIENEDPIRHTFTIEAEGIDVELPAGRARRAELNLAAGTYEVICAVPGHDNMTMSLVVTG